MIRDWPCTAALLSAVALWVLPSAAAEPVWIHDYHQALQTARREGKPIFLVFR